MGRLKIVFYGDDFTGSSENLAQFHRSGARAKLYLRTPTQEHLARDAEDYDVLGLAGTARALSGPALRSELETAFTALSKVDCGLIQYKICSTFDSSPTVGSFGVALDVAEEVFGPVDVPVVAASPDFGRYTCFGNHFARYGEDVLRLDRHPSMATHPSTPMMEADLVRHLAGQTSHRFANVTLRDIQAVPALGALVRKHYEAEAGVVFDAANNDDLSKVAAAVWDISRNRRCFALASQGLAQHLGAYWATAGHLSTGAMVVTEIAPVETVLVLSGSCALQTGRQIDTVEAAGWALNRLDPAWLTEGSSWNQALQDMSEQVIHSIQRGRPTVVYTARGLDGRAAETQVSAEHLGAVYGALASQVRQKTGLSRVVFSGGDSSSFAVKNSGADSLEIAVFDATQNSHVCRLSSRDHAQIDGLEVMLKGGQVGHDDYFLRALKGSATSQAA